MDKLEVYIKEVLKIRNIHRVKENNMSYNIFKVLEVSQKEVVMCRFLADLLNPNGLHGLRDLFLNTFFECVLNTEKNGRYFVNKEYSINNNRRIDIVIKSEESFIPIEVKIFAQDQPSQCYDYLKYAKKFDANAKIIYITLDGHYPSFDSVLSKNKRNSIDENDIVCVSLNEDIVNWLDQVPVPQDCDIKPIIEQFSEAIKTLTNLPSVGYKMDIAELTLSSEDNFRCALDIANTIDAIKAVVMRFFFEELEWEISQIVGKYGLERVSNFNYWEYVEQATADMFKSVTKSTFPGINYRFTDRKLSDGLELWFRVEVDFNLYAGFCVFDTRANRKMGAEVESIKKKTIEEIKEYLEFDSTKLFGWWVNWFYLPSGGNDINNPTIDVPNFKLMNEAAICLADTEKRQDFVKKCADTINGQLELVLKR